MFFLSYRHTDDGVFDNFLKISNHFLKVAVSKIVPKARQTFLNILRKFLKISKDFWRLPTKEDLKMFRSYTNELKYNLRDKLDNSEIDIFTSENIENVRDEVSYEFYEWCIFH